MPTKIERGDPLVSSGFVGYVKKVKNERGDPLTKFALAGLGLSSLSSFISFCKKWYIRDEVCGLTKKKRNKKKLATVRVGHFSLEKRRLKMIVLLITVKLGLKKLRNSVSFTSCPINVESLCFIKTGGVKTILISEFSFIRVRLYYD